MNPLHIDIDWFLGDNDKVREEENQMSDYERFRNEEKLWKIKEWLNYISRGTP